MSFAYLNLSPEAWAALCNGQEAYSNQAPAMLSVAVVREDRLLKRIAELEATPPAQATAAPTDLSAAIPTAVQRWQKRDMKMQSDYSIEYYRELEVADLRKALASQPSAVPQAASLSVKLTEMHESNGNVTWSVLLAKSPEEQPWDCHTVYTDTIKGRAEYEADSLKHFLGLGPEPDMLEYDTDVPAAVPQVVSVPEEVARDAARYRWLKECNGGSIGIVAWHRDEDKEMVLTEGYADNAIDAAIAATPTTPSGEA